MKKILRTVLIIFILLIPIYVKAFTYSNYASCKNAANNYVNKYSDKNKYLLFNKPLEFINGSSRVNNDFRTGGFLSYDEFILSRGANSSYLAIGREYWTLSANGTNRYYYIDHNIMSKSKDDSAGVRVTEFVKPEVNVVGKGTYASPWEFKKQHMVEIRVGSSQSGMVSLSGQNTYSNSLVKMVDTNGELTFDVKILSGYEYNNSDCSLTKVTDVSSNVQRFKTNRITKDTVCTINFKRRVITISYTCGDGSGTAPSQSTVNYGAGYTIAGYTSCTKTGYNQTKWVASDNTSEWAQGTYANFNVENGSRGLVNDRLALHPKFTANTYTITYNNADSLPGSGTPSSYTYGVGATINGKPTKTGYTFNGWSTSSSLTNPSFTQTISTTATGQKTYYAKWCQNCATVSNGSCSLNANTAGTCTYTTSCNTGYTISNSGTYNPTCTANTYTITYNYNGGSAPNNNAGKPSSYTYGVGATINGTNYPPTRSGYTFNGWSTSSGLTNPVFSPTISTTATGQKTYYAKWCQNCATVSNGSCSLNANTAGTCTYTTSCNTGYQITNSGTYNPTCTLIYQTLYLCRDDVAQQWCGGELNSNFSQYCNKARESVFSTPTASTRSGFIVGKNTAVQVYPGLTNQRYKIKSVQNNLMFNENHNQITNIDGNYWIIDGCLSATMNSEDCRTTCNY